MEKMIQQHAQFAPYGLSNLQLAASSLMNPLSYSQQQQVGVSAGSSGLLVRCKGIWLGEMPSSKKERSCDCTF